MAHTWASAHSAHSCIDVAKRRGHHQLLKVLPSTKSPGHSTKSVKSIEGLGDIATVYVVKKQTSSDLSIGSDLTTALQHQPSIEKNKYNRNNSTAVSESYFLRSPSYLLKMFIFHCFGPVLAGEVPHDFEEQQQGGESHDETSGELRHG